MKRVDDNHSEIVKGLRAVGATVRSTASLGSGFPDLAVGWKGSTYLLEVKDGRKPASKRKLTPDEEKFHMEWNGHAAIIGSLDEALREIGAIR